MRKKKPDPYDLEIGNRVRTLRLERSLSQEKLGETLGLTFQQVQKYERGINRISAGRLQRIAEIFKVPVATFFGDAASNTTAPCGLSELVDQAAALRLLRAYARMSNSRSRQALIALAESIAEEPR